MTDVIARSVESDPAEVGFDPARLQRMDGRLQDLVTSERHAAVSIAVVRHDRLVHARSFGRQRVASAEPLRDDAIFRMASMTKPIVGVALMLLYEEGRWQLDDPLEQYLPEFATTRVLGSDGRLVEPCRPITVRHLITSTAGISGFGTVAGGPDNGRGVEVQRRYAAAAGDMCSGGVREVALAVAALPLASEPGERFQYGVSHEVQGALIEVLSGTTLDRFFAERIFKPLGMRDTGFFVPTPELDRLVEMAEYGPDGKLVPSTGPLYPSDDGARGVLPRYQSASGGLYGTLTDYGRFLRALAAGGSLDGVRLLSPSSVDLMTRDLLPDGVAIEFQYRWIGHGYGVNVGIVEDPARATMWSGPVGRGTWYWSGAHGSWFWVDPVNDLIVTGFVQHAFSGSSHMGRAHPAPDVRALSRSLVYQALVQPEV